MRESTPEPGAMIERRSLAYSSGDVGDSIDAVGGTGSTDEVTVEGAAKRPGVTLVG